MPPGQRKVFCLRPLPLLYSTSLTLSPPGQRKVFCLRPLPLLYSTSLTLSPPGQRKVFWQNLREEPLIFLNGQPFVVRESDQPFSNLEYTGVDWGRV